MDPAKQRYRLVSPTLLGQLMQRTGTGNSISQRALAAAAGIPHGTIDHLLNGVVRTQPDHVAYSIARTIGVDLLVLWAPTGRTVPVDGPPAKHMASAP
ncbi:helix-turn-helix transcriptional regulator [Streptomyces sp. NPDC005426]|uniref:helix-turn-helix domain-containing protein n=1 Tax=Streptomyces sp. NPDC005426 TaxID=3155344 RepID=UPI0033A2BF22